MYRAATLERLFCVNGARSGLKAAETGWAKAAKAGSPRGDCEVAGINWGIWEADSLLKGLTRCLNKSFGDSGVLNLRTLTSAWPQNGIKYGKNRENRYFR